MIKFYNQKSYNNDFLGFCTREKEVIKSHFQYTQYLALCTVIERMRESGVFINRGKASSYVQNMISKGELIKEKGCYKLV